MPERKEYLMGSLLFIAGEKKRKLEEIKHLTMRQKQVVHEDSDQDNLLPQMIVLIEEKQRKMNEIDALEENFQKIYAELNGLLYLGRWQDNANHPNKEIRDLYVIMQQNIALLREIQGVDIENTNQMRLHLQAVQDKLKQLRQSKRVVSGYESAFGGVNPYFVDKKR